MRAEIIARQRRSHGRERPRRARSRFAGELRLTTGFVVPSQPLIRRRHAMVIVTADGTPCGGRRRHGGDHDPQPRAGRRRSAIWAEFTDNAMAVPRDPAVRARARVGRGSASRWTTCRPATSRCCSGPCRRPAFSAAEALLARLRQIKTADEIELLRRLSRIADPVDHRRARRGAGGRHRDGHRRRT